MIGNALNEKMEKHWREAMQEVVSFVERSLRGAVSKLMKKCLNDDYCHEVQVKSQMTGSLRNG